MSITNDFDPNLASVKDVSALLSHARALEDMLRNIRDDPMLTLRVQQVWKIYELLE